MRKGELKVYSFQSHNHISPSHSLQLISVNEDKTKFVKGKGGRCGNEKVPSKANNSSQYSSNRESRSSTSTIFSSHTESFISKSWSLSSNAPNRSHGAARWSLRVWDISSWMRSAVVRNFMRRVCKSVRSDRARSSLICTHVSKDQHAPECT